MAKKRAPLSPFTVIGELLLVGGLAVFGYILWQPWYTSTVVAAAQSEIAGEISDQWAKETDESADPQDTDVITDPNLVPAAEVPGYGETFGVLYVPAFGGTYANQIATGTRGDVLDDSARGIGYYEGSAAPGAAGNFAVAVHRSGPLTTPFHNIDFLKVGDPVFVETKEGWYTYRFRSAEYVLPDTRDVLNTFPRVAETGQTPSERILTFTTCNPKTFGWDERMIAYSVFESFTPRAAGVPAELAELNPNLVTANGGKVSENGDRA